jgi:hypothetical protein
VLTVSVGQCRHINIHEHFNQSLQSNFPSAVLWHDEPASSSGNGFCAPWGEPGVQSYDKTLYHFITTSP